MPCTLHDRPASLIPEEHSTMNIPETLIESAINPIAALSDPEENQP